MGKKIRITDIAAMAGVSPGTVDRVLHNRGRVSETSKKKVLEILTKTHYQPNLIARTLSAGRTLNIAVVMPDPSVDPFWEAAQKGLDEAEKTLGPFGLAINTYYYNPGRIRSFQFAAAKSLKSGPDGMLVAPFFQKESTAFIRSAKLAGIPSITFNARATDIETQSFIGQDLYHSGRLAAHLLNLALQPSAKILIIHVEEDFQNSLHLKDKEKGFTAYFKEKYGNISNLKRLELNAGTGRSLKKTFLHTLEKSPDIKGLFVSTSKVYRIADMIGKNGLDGFTLVGYDLLEENLSHLENGHIQFLINQHPGLQTYLGLAFFTDLLIFKKEIPEQKLLPIDIVTAENMDYYKNSQDLLKDMAGKTTMNTT